MDRSRQHGLEHLALATAAVIVYQQVMETPLAYDSVAAMNEILHGVAHALSNVAPIYALDGDSAMPKQLEPIDLLRGEFQRGATILRTPNGTEYRSLSIRRDDMRAAIAILRGAGAKFSPPENLSTKP